MAQHDTAVAGPTRACAACRQRRPVTELIRFVAEGSRVVPDLRRVRGGRGVHLCPAAACIDLAIKKRALPRVLRQPVHVESTELRAAVAVAARQDLIALLLRGQRRDPERSPERSVRLDLDSSLLGELGVGVALGDADERAGPVMVDERLGARLTRLAGLFQQFTFTGPGAMNRRPSIGEPPLALASRAAVERS